MYQPSGMGRRRRRRSDDSSGHEGHVEYFYPVTPGIQPVKKIRRTNSRILNDHIKESFPATNINDNVGVTVLMPPGE